MSNLEESDKEKALRDENSEESAEDTDSTAPSLRLARSDIAGPPEKPKGEEVSCPLDDKGTKGIWQGGKCVPKPKE